MNARRLYPLAHAATGLTIPWTPALAALYPADLRDPTDDVTVDVGRFGRRLVVQLVDGGPWLDLSALPADAAEAIEAAEQAAYRAHAEGNARDRRERDREAAGLARFEEREAYRFALGL